MRRILGIVLATTLAGPVLAADMNTVFKAPAYAPAFSWTGTYVGANVGGIWGTFDVSPASTNNLNGAVVAPGALSINNSSLIGGVQAGYNWQIGQWVLGLEQDYQFTGLKQTAKMAAPSGPFLAGAQKRRSEFRYFDDKGAELVPRNGSIDATRVARIRITIVSLLSSHVRWEDSTRADSIDVALQHGRAR